MATRPSVFPEAVCARFGGQLSRDGGGILDRLGQRGALQPRSDVMRPLTPPSSPVITFTLTTIRGSKGFCGVDFARKKGGKREAVQSSSCANSQKGSFAQSPGERYQNRRALM